MMKGINLLKLCAGMLTGSSPPPTPSYYKRPGGVDEYLRPGGIDKYRRS